MREIAQAAERTILRTRSLLGYVATSIERSKVQTRSFSPGTTEKTGNRDLERSSPFFQSYPTPSYRAKKERKLPQGLRGGLLEVFINVRVTCDLHLWKQTTSFRS